MYITLLCVKNHFHLWFVLLYKKPYFSDMELIDYLEEKKIAGINQEGGIAKIILNLYICYLEKH